MDHYIGWAIFLSNIYIFFLRQVPQDFLPFAPCFFFLAFFAQFFFVTLACAGIFLGS